MITADGKGAGTTAARTRTRTFGELTYRDCARMLGSFFAAVQEEPAPEARSRPRETPGPEFVVRVIREWSGYLGDVGFRGDDETISGSLWYSNAVKGNASDSRPAIPDWADLSFVSSGTATIVGLIPNGKIVSQVLDLVRSSVIDFEKRAALKEPDNVLDPITAMEGRLKTFIDLAGIEQDLSAVLSTSAKLRGILKRMLIEPPGPDGATQGFSSTWVAPAHSKEAVLAEETGLGAVWGLLAGPLDRLVEDEQVWHRVPALGLAAGPTHAMCTISAYRQVLRVVVDALIVYSLVCVMPEEALRPGWDARSFDLDEALSRNWSVKPENCSHSAKQCWETLYECIKPLWLTRIGPETGDAMKAWRLIRDRLERIQVRFGVEPNRDGRWYLAQGGTIAATVYGMDWANDADDAFRGACRSGGLQDELRDPTVLDVDGDTFADPYAHFTTDLTIQWDTPHETAVRFDGGRGGWAEAIPAAEALVYMKSRGTYTSPWDGAGGTTGAIGKHKYEQVSWTAAADPHFVQSFYEHYDYIMEGVQMPAGSASGDVDAWATERAREFFAVPIVREAISWMAFVLANYCEEMHYELYPAPVVDDTTGARSWMSTLQAANSLFDQLAEVHARAEELLIAGSSKVGDR